MINFIDKYNLDKNILTFEKKLKKIEIYIKITKQKLIEIINNMHSLQKNKCYTYLLNIFFPLILYSNVSMETTNNLKIESDIKIEEIKFKINFLKNKLYEAEIIKKIVNTQLLKYINELRTLSNKLHFDEKQTNDIIEYDFIPIEYDFNPIEYDFNP